MLSVSLQSPVDFNVLLGGFESSGVLGFWNDMTVAYSTGDDLVLEVSGPNGSFTSSGDDGPPSGTGDALSFYSGEQLIATVSDISLDEAVGFDVADGAPTFFGLFMTEDIWFTGSDGNDAFASGSGADVLAGGEGDDVLRGALGADLIDGGAGDDTLYGGGGGDTLISGGGDDKLVGGGGADVLTSGGIFFSPAEAEMLTKPVSHVRLIGGEGDDVFDFDLPHAWNRVVDYTAGEDMIDLIGLTTGAPPVPLPLKTLMAVAPDMLTTLGDLMGVETMDQIDTADMELLTGLNYRENVVGNTVIYNDTGFKVVLKGMAASEVEADDIYVAAPIITVEDALF